MELNYLIWRYLQESGLDLAAFALEKISKCLTYEHSSNLEIISKIEPGCLVNLVQKGILYTLAQNEAMPEKPEKFTLLGTLLEEEVIKQKYLEDSSNNVDLDANEKEKNKSLQNSEVEKDNFIKADLNSKEDVEMEDGNEQELSNHGVDNKSKEQKGEGEELESEEDIEFSTKILEPKIKFSESLASDWHPITDVFAYGKEDSTAVINAIHNDAIAESVTLSHPNLIIGLNDISENIQNEVNIVAWAPSGNIIITASTNGELRAWSPDGKLKNIAKSSLSEETDDPSSRLLDSPALIECLSWSDNGQYLLTIDLLNQICLWDGNNLNLIQQIRPPSQSIGEIANACWVADSKVAISTPKNVIQIYSVNSSPNTSIEPVNQIGYLSGHENNITLLKFNAESKLLASVSDSDYLIRIWNSNSSDDYLELNNSSSKPIDGLKVHKAPIVGLFWLNGGDKSGANDLLTVSMEGVINIWNAFSGKSIISTSIFKKTNFKFEDSSHEVKATDSLIFSAKISPNKKLLALGEDSGLISIWDVSHYSSKRPSSLNCLGVYFMEDSNSLDSKETDIGMCDLSWDSKSLKVSVSYKGTDSVILYWG